MHWWQLHHPETARPAPTSCDGLTLTRMPGSDWNLEGEESTVPAGVTS